MSKHHHRLFWRQFRENFVDIGAALPSSAALGQAGAAYLAQKQGPARVLEAGAGTGSFTKEIIPLLDEGDILDVVEINPVLLAVLQHRLNVDPAFQNDAAQINVVNADLSRFPFCGEYDYIVFSLPLTNFPSGLVQEILSLMVQHLKPGGVFSYVKYIFFDRLKYNFSDRSTKLNLTENRQIINQFAQQYQFDQRVVLANAPPTWVYYWRKPLT